jgi:tetratricopeptide (TPR) repeat protein
MSSTVAIRVSADKKAAIAPEPSPRSRGLLHAALIVLTVVAFSQAFGNGFTNWDDPDYITRNRLVHGFSLERLLWAFTHFHLYNYNPLHLVSYMVDFSLWDLDPRGYLLTSLCFHIGAGLLVLEVLLRLTGKPLVATLGAICFLVHPTRCESVVWLSERKDVLSGFFAVLSLWFYVRWQERDAERPVAVSRSHWAWYCAALGAFLCALLSKSQLVTLPLVLMALDVFRRRISWSALVIEKLPFLALSAIFTVVTLAAHAGIAVPTGDSAVESSLSLTRPLGALPHYVLHCLVPLGLSPYYDLLDFSSLEILLGGVVLVALVVGSVVSLKGRRVFFMSSCWFGFFLLPVIGVVANTILIADRYLYLALIGPAWVVGDVLARYVRPVRLRVGIALVALVLSGLTWGYSERWRDSETLWAGVVDRYPDCSVAQANLGMHLLEEGRIEAAVAYFEDDLRERPYMAQSFLGRASAHLADDALGSAENEYERLLEVDPHSTAGIVALANLHLTRGDPARALMEVEARKPHPSFDLDELLFKTRHAMGEKAAALEHAESGVRRNPFHEEGWFHLGLARESSGAGAGALDCYQRAVECAPVFHEAHVASATLLARTGRATEALASLDGAPERDVRWWNLRALVLLDTGATRESLAAIREASRLAPDQANYHANHARIALRVGSVEEARQAVSRAMELEPEIRGRLETELVELLDVTERQAPENE